MTAISYRPEIDGLRAFAVIPVVLFHMDYRWISGGFIGVDVFFVISGFLITSILNKELGLGTFSFRNFLARRIRRILPAMLVVSAFTLLVTYGFSFRPDRPVVGMQGIAAMASFANIYFWRTAGDYWGADADKSPFLHTWSLSVEEQFYLFFPVLMWIAFALRPRWIQGLISAVMVLSLSLFLYGLQTHPTATFYLLPTRAWELATGCILATMLSANGARVTKGASFASSLAAVGLCLVMTSYIFVTTLNGGLVIAVLGTALVLAFGQSGFCYTILSHPLVVHIGKISYSLYLWHWPILVFADAFDCKFPKIFFLVPIYLLSLASYLLVECPARRSPRTVPVTAVCYLLTGALSFGLACSTPFYDTSEFEPSAWVPNNCHPRQDYSQQSMRLKLGATQLVTGDSSSNAYLEGGILYGTGESSPQIVVLGDSHGCMWSDAILAVTQKLGVKTSLYLMDGVPPYVTFPLSHT
jgi:peptidoglycan/LPS O-acetylase OafA/YrhL